MITTFEKFAFILQIQIEVNLLISSQLRCIYLFYKYRQVKGGKKRGKETLIAACALIGGQNPQPRHVPWPGIKPDLSLCRVMPHGVTWVRADCYLLIHSTLIAPSPLEILLSYYFYNQKQNCILKRLRD